MKHVALILMMVMGGMAWAGDQPFPKMGESAEEFVERWEIWSATVPEDHKAWSLMQQVDMVIQREADKGIWFYPNPNADTTEDQEEWERTVDFVQNNPELIEKIYSYTQRIYPGFPLNKSSSLYWQLEGEGYVAGDTPFPENLSDIVPLYLSIMRSHANLLLVDMYIAIQNGQYDRVLLDLQAIKDMGRLSLTTGTFLEQLMAQVFGNMICNRVLGQEIKLDLLTDQQLVKLADIVQEIDDMYDIQRSLQFERLASYECLDWLYEESEQGRIGPLGLARIVDTKASMSMQLMLGLGSYRAPEVDFVVALGAVLAQSISAPESEQRDLVTAYFDGIESDLNQPLFKLQEWSFPERSPFDNGDPFESVRMVPASSCVYSFNLPYILSNAPVRFDAARLLISLHRHKLRHGVFPVAISGIDKDILTYDTVDLFDGFPLKYKLVDAQPLIYSVGTDRDDDGGKSVSTPWSYGAKFLTLDELEEVNNTDPESIDGDWILYPFVSE